MNQLQICSAALHWTHFSGRRVCWWSYAVLL